MESSRKAARQLAERRLAGRRCQRKEIVLWTPEWLYERLPALYLAGGLACVWLLDTSFAATLSALLLLGAALLTLGLRRSARREAAAPSAGRVAKANRRAKSDHRRYQRSSV
jgi:hypothetical protein